MSTTCAMFEIPYSVRNFDQKISTHEVGVNVSDAFGSGRLSVT
ncbi:hypothetical protein QF035_001755 [Streptomyces umbrinus]|uniref:Uncharacterized protein n=1 Tax=Streptomyces umbrinus TaxID=67370 RepID=A0ABU0SKZ9_9ACTN|nr:hypothetical protein [Streptomyces umbrinus]